MADLPRQIVIGIDSGGSTTRVACVDRDARIVGLATGAGGSPEHNSTSEAEVRSTLARAIADADRTPADAVALVAGMAGLNAESDHTWAVEHTHLDGLTAARTHVNDTVIAHVGAFLGQPGVLVVAGTGSMILGIDRDGRHYRNDHVHHYAGAARHLAYDVVHRIVVGEHPHDELVPVALQHWQVADVRALRAAIEAPYESEAVKRSLGTFAPEITRRSGSSALAQSAIEQLAARTALGVRLVGEPLGDEVVHWSAAGSLATHATFIDAVTRELHRSSGPYRFAPAATSPLGGAVLLALRAAGWETGSTVDALTAALSD